MAVPQGSILDQLLFLIGMYDIPSQTRYFTFILYADDTALFSKMSYSLPALPNEHDLYLLTFSNVSSDTWKHKALVRLRQETQLSTHQE